MNEEFYLCAVEVISEHITGKVGVERFNIYYACTDFHLNEFFTTVKNNAGINGLRDKLTLLSRIPVSEKEYNYNQSRK